MIKQSTGIIIFAKGEEQIIPKDYSQDKRDPLIWHPPELEFCIHRDWHRWTAPDCKCEHKEMLCNYYERETSTQVCMECTINKEK